LGSNNSGRLTMSNVSRILLASTFGALLATGLFDGPLSFVSADQFTQPAGVTDVVRAGKGDRLQVAPDAGTTIIIRRTAPTARDGDPRLVPASLTDCEPLASPYADPKLGKLAGRCFV
jgi:hypothetical protein